MSAGLVTAATLADYLGVSRAWVYENALRLGAVRLGDGPKARLRFDLEHARSTLSCSAGRESERPLFTQRAAPRTRRRRPSGTNVDLLPIRGQKAA